MLNIKNISHAFNDVKIFSSFSLSLKPKEFACLIGPSGSGKSTLLRLIAGLEILQSGEIKLGNSILANSKYSMPPEKREIGLVFQYPSLFPHLNLLENVNFAIKNNAGKKNQNSDDKYIATLLKRIGIEHLQTSYPHMLSGGQYQKAALARAVVASPKLMLLDEPFANIDTISRRRIRGEMRDFIDKIGITCLMITHSPEEALILGDRIIVIGDGGIKQIGTGDEIFHNPIDIETAELFGRINIIEVNITSNKNSDKENLSTIFGEIKNADLLTRIHSMRKNYGKKNHNNKNHNKRIQLAIRPQYILCDKSGEEFRVMKNHFISSGYLINAENSKKENIQFLDNHNHKIGDKVKLRPIEERFMVFEK